MSLTFTDAGAFATAPRGGSDAYALKMAGEMLSRHPGAYQSVQKATGVPIHLLKALGATVVRAPIAVAPVARVVRDGDWSRARPTQVKMRRRVTVAEIQAMVCEHFRLPAAAMICERRSRDFARPRQIAMYLCKQHTTRSYPDLGRRFGGRDHTTVLHAVSKIEELLETDEAIVRHVNDLTMRLSIGERRLDDIIARTERRLSSLKAMRANATLGLAA